MKSEKLCTDIQFTYSEGGSLVGFQVVEDIKLEPRTVADLLENALTLDLLNDLCKRTGRKLMVMDMDLSFASFWNKYNYKDGGSKKDAEKIWDKMPENKRVAAMIYITKYNALLAKQQVAKLYATTYLRQERWNNE